MPCTGSRQSSTSNPRSSHRSPINRIEETCLTPTVTFDSDDGFTNGSRSVVSDGFLSNSAISSQAHTPATTATFDPSKLGLPDKRRQELLGGATYSAKFNSVAEHTARFSLRTVRSWPRLMAMHGTMHLPPMMHRLQFVEGTPTALSNCLTLLDLWHNMNSANEQLVHDTVLAEIKRLMGTFSVHSPRDLLADCQSLLMLMITLFLGFGDAVTRDAHDPSDGEILVASWCMKEQLARTGLFLDAEVDHSLPDWREWAFTACKRRTILAMHHLEWAWSLMKGYPVLTCFELGPLPAPEPGYMWQETDERRWKRQYEKWLTTWRDGGGYRMYEFFHIGPKVEMDERTERWYAEADDFGMMLIAEVNSSLEVAAMNA
ncbi:Zn2/Cys6 DNA-binding protein [Sarocladium implicatum]|nr:Zn2/Cys6 DNA-binding protein [Sarocladium implicatum]